MIKWLLAAALTVGAVDVRNEVPPQPAKPMSDGEKCLKFLGTVDAVCREARLSPAGHRTFACVTHDGASFIATIQLTKL